MEFRRLIGAPKIRFAKPEDLSEILGITPGAVSPLGLVNDTNNKVTSIVDIIYGIQKRFVAIRMLIQKHCKSLDQIFEN